MTAWWGIALLGIALAVWWPIRGRIAARKEQQFMEANPRGADGFIIGSAPYTLSGTRSGAVLLLHGYNDSPQSLLSMARIIHARGWTVHVPALPGHGRTLQAFAASGADQWITAARAELRTLQYTHADIAVGGLSMGGAIALMLAAETRSVRAVVAFAPYVHASAPLHLFAAVAPLAALRARWVSGGGGRSVRDPVAAAAMIAYRQSTPRLLVQLAHVVHRTRAILSAVRQPVLVLQSREDNRIPMASAQEAFARIGSADKTLQWSSGSAHVITVDYGYENVGVAAADWLETRLP
jgi:carboxylesterase